MRDCTILIPVINEIQQLKGSLEAIGEFEPDVKIIIANQTGRELWFNDKNIEVVSYPKHSYGYSIDRCIGMVDTEWFCTMDADCFPISPDFLRKPISILKERCATFAGSDTGLSIAYPKLGKFLAINNWFRVSRTETTKLLSGVYGFARNEDSSVKHDEWADDGVYANRALGDEKKVVLPITRAIGMTPKQGLYGIVLDELVFHMVFGNTRTLMSDEQMKNELGADYLQLLQRIEQGGLTKELRQELVAMAKPINYKVDYP